MQSPFPTEINLATFYKIRGYSNALKACRESDICGWDFWRNKAFLELDVPEWYFDLPLAQNRQISPSQRYLEITSRFWLIPESVARIENGKVEGVYFPHQANKFAAKQGNLEIYLLTTQEEIPKQIRQIEDRIRAKRVGIVLPSDLEIGNYDPNLNERFANQFGEELAKIFISSSYADRKEEIIQSAENVLEMLRDRDFDAIEIALENRTSILDVGALAASGDERAFSIVERIFSTETLDNKTTILSFLAGSRKPEQFIRLFQRPDTKRLSALLQRAYFVAEQTLVDFLKQFAHLSEEILVGNLYNGYLYDARPVEVYQIVEKEIESARKGVDFPLELRDLAQIDTDIFILAISDTHSKAKNFTFQALAETITLPGSDGSLFPVGAVKYSIELLKLTNYDFVREYSIAKTNLRTLLREHGIDFAEEPKFYYRRNISGPMGQRVGYTTHRQTKTPHIRMISMRDPQIEALRTPSFNFNDPSLD